MSGKSINLGTRMRLFEEALKDLREGDVYRCTGLDDAELCSDIDGRDGFNCKFCEAASRVEGARPFGKGFLRKERL